MPSDFQRHRIRPLGRSMEARSRPGFDQDRDADARHREADAAFVKRVLMALWRGDDVPAGRPRPVRPLVLTP